MSSKNHGWRFGPQCSSVQRRDLWDQREVTESWELWPHEWINSLLDTTNGLLAVGGNFRRWLLVVGSKLLRVRPWRVYFVLGPFLSLPVCFLDAMKWALPALPQAQSDGAWQLQTEISETISQNKFFLPRNWLPWIFCHSDTKQANPTGKIYLKDRF
jgi:hypothetical protein